MVVYFHIVEIVYITISYRRGKCNPGFADPAVRQNMPAICYNENKVSLIRISIGFSIFACASGMTGMKQAYLAESGEEFYVCKGKKRNNRLRCGPRLILAAIRYILWWRIACRTTWRFWPMRSI